MRHRSVLWENLAKRGNFSMDVKLQIGATEYASISAPKIYRSAMSAPLSVGDCIAASMSVSVLTEDEIPPSEAVTVLGRLTDGENTTEWKKFGTFYIDQRDTSYEGVVTLNCYDAMLRANQNYLDTSDTSTGWPKQMVDVVSEIAERLGVAIDPRTKIKTGDEYWVSRPKDLTMMQVLGYIGACHGGNWVVTEDNALRLVYLSTAPDVTHYIVDEDYNKIRSQEGDNLVYELQTVFNEELPAVSGVSPNSAIEPSYGLSDVSLGKVNVPAVLGQLKTGKSLTVTGVVATDKAGNGYTMGDNSGMVIRIDGNPYISQEVCEDLYASFRGLTYQPFSASKTVYDPAIELGDQVIIGDRVHSIICGINAVLDVSFRADISAPDSKELNAEYPYLTEYKKINTSMQNTIKRLEDTETRVQQTHDEVLLRATQTDFDDLGERVTTAESAISVQAGRISLVTTANGIKAAEIVTAINGSGSTVKIAADHINIDGVLSIGNIPTVSDLPTKVSDLENDEGFQSATGVTTIVGGMITTDYINALGITAKSITVPHFSASQSGVTIAGWKVDASSIYSHDNDVSWQDGVFVCTGSDSPYSIAGSDSKSGWCFGAGGKFGVTKAGEVWAKNIHILPSSSLNEWSQIGPFYVTNNRFSSFATVAPTDSWAWLMDTTRLTVTGPVEYVDGREHQQVYTSEWKNIAKAGQHIDSILARLGIST